MFLSEISCFPVVHFLQSTNTCLEYTGRYPKLSLSGRYPKFQQGLLNVLWGLDWKYCTCFFNCKCVHFQLSLFFITWGICSPLSPAACGDTTGNQRPLYPFGSSLNTGSAIKSPGAPAFHKFRCMHNPHPTVIEITALGWGQTCNCEPFSPKRWFSSAVWIGVLEGA